MLVDRNHCRHPGRGGGQLQLPAGHGHQHPPLLRLHPLGIPGQHHQQQHEHNTGQNQVKYLKNSHKILQEDGLLPDIRWYCTEVKTQCFFLPLSL